MFRTSYFDKNLDNACSHLRLEPDWPLILEICDSIRQADVTPKHAIQSIKKKMLSPNPHTALYSLLVLESVVKNCGTPVHDEIGTKENCEMFSSLIETTPHENVKAKMLELIQAWAYAFRSSDKYQAIKDTMTILKTKGNTFPELKEADAMFTSDTAPGWLDGKCCHRCRVEFSFTQRKHHCRNCGQIFCGQCSSNTCTLPKFGIEKEVRVCEGCYLSLQKPVAGGIVAASRPADNPNDLPAEYLTSSLAQQSQTPARKTDQELKEEEELQLALALSQSEAEIKKTQSSFRPTYRKTASPENTANNSFIANSSPIATDISGMDDRNTDPELAKYLNRDYWEQRGNNGFNSGKMLESPASPSAPSPMVTPQPSLSSNSSLFGMKSETDDTEIDNFASTMRAQVEIFVNRMKSDSSRGRSISTDSSVQTLFLNLTAFHSRLLGYIKEADDKRMWFEQLQDKLTQIKDSRAALDVLRQEHQDKLRQQAEEQERQRQMQMAYKLELMRKKKQEYLQYQRQLALQRIQEQEREMQMHQEQQKVMYSMGVQGYGPPGASFITSPPATGGSPGHMINAAGGVGQLAGNYGSPQAMPMYAMPPQSLGPQSLGPQSLGPQSLGPQPLGHYSVPGQQQPMYSLPRPPHQQQQQHPGQPLPLPGQYPTGMPGNPSPVHLPQGMQQPSSQPTQQPPHTQADYLAAAQSAHAHLPPHLQQQPNQGLAYSGAIYSPGIHAANPAPMPQQHQPMPPGMQGIVQHQQPSHQPPPALQQPQPAPAAVATQPAAEQRTVPAPEADPPKESIPHVVEAELISFD